MYEVKCAKCSGTGIVDCYRYNDAGVCYDCNGAGRSLRKTKPAELACYYVTAIVNSGYEGCGSRSGVYVDAKNERDAVRKARLHPDAYDLDTLIAEVNA